jgi:hypothetical protein
VARSRGLAVSPCSCSLISVGNDGVSNADRLLPLRRRGSADRSLPGGACPPAPHRLQVPRHRAGRQRGRRPVGRRRARPCRRARLGLPAGPQRVTGLRGHRSRHRSPRGSSGGIGRSRCCPRVARPSRSPWRRAPPGPSTWPSASAAPGRSSPPAAVVASTVTAPPASSDVSPAEPRSPSRSARTPCAPRFITAALDAGVPLRDVQEAASHADPRTSPLEVPH